MSPVSLARPRVSFSELQQYPEDGLRYELYDGELIELSSPFLLHQVVVGHLFDLRRDHRVGRGGRGGRAPRDVGVDEFNVLEPDLLFVVADRLSLLDLRQHVRVPPDLVVEVLSPSTAWRDRGVKMRMYATYGVPEYWIVDPDARQIQIHNLTDGKWLPAQRGESGAEVESTVLEGLRFDPARLFER